MRFIGGGGRRRGPRLGRRGDGEPPSELCRQRKIERNGDQEDDTNEQRTRTTFPEPRPWHGDLHPPRAPSDPPVANDGSGIAIR